MLSRRQFQIGVLIITLIGCLTGTIPAGAIVADSDSGTIVNGRLDYAKLARSAITVLANRYYTGAGTWNMCVPAICNVSNYDWGADSLTYSLYFDWQLTRDPQVAAIMTALAGTAREYDVTGSDWSDAPEWDAVADIREHQVTHDQVALTKAQAAFDVVDSVDAASFATGHCPSIDYQRPNGGHKKLKTLETDSNYVKAAILLYQVTGTPSYLAKARQKYLAVRNYFLSDRSALYTAYVRDTGRRCNQKRGQYFASANGNMIWAGAELARLTGAKSFLAQAIATARAVGRYLCDYVKVFSEPQVDNDVVEPLVEAMYLLARSDHQLFARDWLLGAASAAAGDRTLYGTYGRMPDGPPPTAPVTAWQVNGGISLMIAAAKLDPHGLPADPWFWRKAAFVPHDVSLPADGTGQVRVPISGRAIAIVGTLGEASCCHPGHAQVYIDGRRMFNRIGIWQGKFSGKQLLAGSILFAWRWPEPGKHTITIAPATRTKTDGATFFHMTGYYVVH